MDARLTQFSTISAPPQKPEAVVRLLDFTRTFGTNTIISGLDLEIAAGEFVVLLGRSGSGKTTLLRTLAGLDGTEGQEVTVPVSRAVVFQDAGCCRGRRSGETSRSA